MWRFTCCLLKHPNKCCGWSSIFYNILIRYYTTKSGGKSKNQDRKLCWRQLKFPLGLSCLLFPCLHSPKSPNLNSESLDFFLQVKQKKRDRAKRTLLEESFPSLVYFLFTSISRSFFSFYSPTENILVRRKNTQKGKKKGSIQSVHHSIHTQVVEPRWKKNPCEKAAAF